MPAYATYTVVAHMRNSYSAAALEYAIATLRSTKTLFTEHVSPCRAIVAAPVLARLLRTKAKAWESDSVLVICRSARSTVSKKT